LLISILFIIRILSLDIGLALGLLLETPAKFADEFSSTVLIVAPSFHGLG